MVISAKNKVAAGYVCAFLILMVGVLAMRALFAVEDARHWGQHARDVRSKVSEIESTVLEAQSSQRSYLVTRNPRYLIALQKATTEVPGQLEKLKDMIRGDERHLKQFDSFRDGMLARLAQLNETVRRFDADPRAPVVLTEESGAEQTHALYRDLFFEEQEFVVARERTHAMLRNLSIIIGAGTALASVLVILVTIWIGRSFDAEVQTNEALRQSNIDLEQFAYVASHDLKAPLRGILNLSMWIEEDLANKATPQTKSLLEKLRGRVRRLEDLIAGIAAYSRAGRVGAATELLNVEALVRNVAQLLNLPENIELKVESPLPTFYSDRVPLEQVFTNLISNAAKHGCRNGGKITVRSEDGPQYVRFFVSDDGPGIPAEFHQRIFELFQTLEPRDKVEGSGIGLAIVKKLVERYEGTVDLVSHPGAGATFSFTWRKGEPT